MLYSAYVTIERESGAKSKYMGILNAGNSSEAFSKVLLNFDISEVVEDSLLQRNNKYFTYWSDLGVIEVVVCPVDSLGKISD